ARARSARGAVPCWRGGLNSCDGRLLFLSLLRDRSVILAQDILVALHEALARIGVHFQALVQGQMAPHVLVRVGDGVFLERIGLVVLGAESAAAFAFFGIALGEPAATAARATAATAATLALRGP